jgi:putative transposase
MADLPDESCGTDRGGRLFRGADRDLWFARIRAGTPRVDPPCHERHNRGVLNMVALLIRAVGLACRGHHELVLENLALRQQLNALKRRTSRPQLRTRDRLFWVILARTWRNWRSALVLVRPDTVVRWHRETLRRRWTRQSARNRVGRPRTDAAIRRLVRTMAAANPLWGAPRIHGELGKVGVEVSERTVSRLLGRPRRTRSQTWRTFLTNHVATLVSMDFFTVPTLTGRVLFVFVLLAHHRRRIVHFNVTEHPTAAWTAQQVIDAFPDDIAPRWVCEIATLCMAMSSGAAWLASALAK